MAVVERVDAGITLLVGHQEKGARAELVDGALPSDAQVVTAAAPARNSGRFHPFAVTRPIGQGG